MSDLLKAISAAGDKDLDEVRRKIEGLQKELEGLRQVEKILDRKLNGKPERAAGPGGAKLADRIAACIRADGPATIDDLATPWTPSSKPSAWPSSVPAGSFRWSAIATNSACRRGTERRRVAPRKARRTRKGAMPNEHFPHRRRDVPVHRVA